MNKKPTLKEQIEQLKAALAHEQKRHWEMRKELKWQDKNDPEGVLADAEEEIEELKSEVERLKKDAEMFDSQMSKSESKVSDLKDKIEGMLNYEKEFMVALELLGMTEWEFLSSKRASDVRSKMPELCNSRN